MTAEERERLLEGGPVRPADVPIEAAELAAVLGICMAPLTWRNWRSILGNSLRRLLRRRTPRPSLAASVTTLRLPAARAPEANAPQESGARSKRAKVG